MRSRILLLAGLTVALMLAPLVNTSAASAAPTIPAGAAIAPHQTLNAPDVPAGQVRAACVTAPDGAVSCNARQIEQTASAAAPTRGYRPADVQAAYGLTGKGGASATVGIVDAYGYQKAAADLAVYRRTFGLPACTTTNGCLTIVNQHGATTPLPPSDAGWGLETALDLQAASATCPQCHLLLVEADSPTGDDLAEAENTAVTQGASVVSNSYGGTESAAMSTLRKAFTHPGTPILASTGDSGFQPAQFPSVFSSVIAVGGTTLLRTNSGRGFTESAWSGAGSGCSAYVKKPSWQHDTNCGMRMASDLSALADPKTGLAIYDTYGIDTPGWVVVGGTSLSTPLVAGMIASTGHAAKVNAATIYAHSSGLRDVVGGSNGYCGGDYICTGVVGYDGPTGLGTPIGLTAFAAQ